MTSIDSGSADAPGDETFFDRVYDQHRGALHAYLVSGTGDPEATLDQLQEAFVRVWHNLDMLQELEPDRRRYWLFAVARNLLTDYYRSRAARLVAEQELGRDPEEALCSLEGPAEKLEQEEELRVLDVAIRRLPEDLRTVLVMQVLAEMSSAQIGQMLGRPAGTVRYNISIARKRLAEEMGLMEDDSVGEENCT